MATAVEMPPQKPSSPSSMALVSALGQFCFSSVAMMLGNKMAVDSLPLPCTLVIIQAIGTLILLGVFRSQLQPMKMEVVQQWAPIAILFTCMLYTSLKTFVYVNVSTVIIFRNIGAILTTIVEYYVRGVTVTPKVIGSEVLIVVGAFMYGHANANFNWTGLFWIMCNVCGQVAYGVLVKHQMDTYPHFRDMSKFTMSMYNNALALPLLFFVMVVQQEHVTAFQIMESVTPFGWGVILATCVVGFMISTSGFGLQKLVSATTFLVVNNLTKFLNILLGMMFLSDKLVGLVDAGGCLVALFAGFWYSYEMMKMNDAKKAAAAKNEAK